MKKILVNDGLREFLDPKEFFVKRYDENMKEGNTECFGLRQTGRTTRMIIETIQKVVENPESKFTILTHNGWMCSRIIGLINHYKYQLDVEIPTFGKNLEGKTWSYFFRFLLVPCVWWVLPTRL